MAVPCVIKILGATATSFAAVDYNENKVAEGVAECVALRNFGPLEQYNFHAADTMKKYLQKMLVSPTLFPSLLTSVWVAFFCFFGSENLIGKPLFFMYIIFYLYICKFKQIYNAI